nr:ferritin family protein [uncultured Azospirillum sp.]
MDVAVGMEHEAALRYGQLAGIVARQGKSELAALFGRLAELEKAHEDELTQWAERDGLRAPQPVRFDWRMPETFDQAEGAQLFGPYEALAVAVRNEERAFAFYTYVAASALTEEVRRRAEGMAREELEHVSLLRRWRREAFHASRQPRRRTPRTLEELFALSAAMEIASAEVNDAAAAAVGASGAVEAAAVLRRLADKARGHAGGAASNVPGSDAAEGARASGLLRPGLLTAEGAVRLSIQDAEEILDTYLAAAEHATEETLLNEAQKLAEQSLGRLALTRSLLADPDRA